MGPKEVGKYYFFRTSNSSSKHILNIEFYSSIACKMRKQQMEKQINRNLGESYLLILVFTLHRIQRTRFDHPTVPKDNNLFL